MLSNTEITTANQIGLLGRWLTPTEVDFLLEDEHIEIVPHFGYNDKLYFISGDVGPFKANIKASVPLWLALNIRKSGLCKLIAPEWFNAVKLAGWVEDEKKHEALVNVPENMFHVARALLSAAPEDFPNSEILRRCIQVLSEIRHQKILKSFGEFSYDDAYKLPMDVTEANEIRPFLYSALDLVYAHRKQQLDIEEEDDDNFESSLTRDTYENSSFL
jgi:GINS complex subunit 2